jgi:NAD(P)-dependent dehydrogenase (short-subunit alcohol dehydrogenase family)
MTSDLELDGRVALVTGAASGLGRAVTHDLTAQGCHVLAADIALEGAAQTAELASQQGPGKAEAVALDVTDRDAVDEVVGRAAREHGGRFDTLVSNAGTDRGADLVEVSDEDWHGVFAVNVHGPMYLGRSFVRELQRHGETSTADIVCVVSISALTVGAGAAAYNSSKAAMLKLAEVMQTEAREREWPARVTIVNPAAMNTPMMEQWGLPDERMMDPSAVARVIRTAITLPPELVMQNVVLTMRNETYPR